MSSKRYNISTKNIHLFFTIGDHFWGKIQILFDLKSKTDKPIFLDFRGLSIANLTINEKASTNDQSFRNHKVYLEAELLQEKNKVIFNNWLSVDYRLNYFLRISTGKMDWDCIHLLMVQIK